MANHKSAIKRAKQNVIRRLRNKTVKTKVKNIVKDVRSAIAESATDVAKQSFEKAKSIIDTAAQKGVLHKKTAARKISRLAKAVNQTIKAS